MADQLDLLRRHIVNLRGMIDQPEIRDLAKSAGERGLEMINTHTTEGRFLGGPFKDKPYSERDLPVFFFGEAKYIERSGNIRVTNRMAKVTNRLIPKNRIRWVTSGGKPTPILVGGYAAWLSIVRPGKNVNVVDHTMTGDMLRALDYSMNFATGSAEVQFYVRDPHGQKAVWTHRKREWLGFHRDEIDELAGLAVQMFGDRLRFELAFR